MSRLYYDDPALLTFEAKVMACVTHGDGHRVALDRSAFYPTSGGQPHDVGTLNADGTSVNVTGVEADDEEVVWHDVPSAIAVGTRVGGAIDAARRHDLRQQHSGQHILSASFDAVVGARTESVHLGMDVSTLDLDREVSADEIARVEGHANAVVWSDRPVTIRYADATELASEPRLRKATARTGRIRLIDITDHDLSACGGTHVHRTGEVGLIAVRGFERFRGGTRVTFLCGNRVLASYRDLKSTVDALAQVLSVGVRDVAAAVERLRDGLRDEQRRSREMGERLTVLQADELAATAGADGIVVAHLAGADAQSLRGAASRIVEAPGRVVALLGGETPHALVVARSKDRVDVDSGAIVKRVCAAHGGKGGGRPDLAQAGGVSATVDDLRGLLPAIPRVVL
ncbi:MAG TPA: DHHA1 domain-containing protein [Luteitalea sp.]|nr:DHHA1 domain-containing protein [Luteitalea sp.]